MKAIKIHMIILALLALMLTIMTGLAEAGRLTGMLTDADGNPMKGVIVFFFNADSGPPPNPDIYWKAPDETTGTDGGGAFAVELLAGNYYFGARDDVAWTHSGPPKGEDIYFLGMGPGSGLKTLSVKDGTENDAGTMSVKDLVKIIAASEKGVTTIEGTVINKNDEPAAEVVVEAYSTSDAAGELPYVSEYTGEEGMFIMKLHKGGKYYLRTRSRYKGRSPDDVAPVSVTVKTGETLGGVVLKVK